MTELIYEHSGKIFVASLVVVLFVGLAPISVVSAGTLGVLQTTAGLISVGTGVLTVVKSHEQRKQVETMVLDDAELGLLPENEKISTKVSHLELEIVKLKTELAVTQAASKQLSDKLSIYAPSFFSPATTPTDVPPQPNPRRP